MAQVLSLQRPRPGFEPQVCIISLLFFHCNSYAGITLKRIMLPQHPKSHASSCFKSRAGIQRTHYALVNAPYGTWESQRISSLLGLNYWIHTSMLGQKTPLVCFSIHFFILFSIMILFSLFVKLINYFFTKYKNAQKSEKREKYNIYFIIFINKLHVNI